MGDGASLRGLRQRLFAPRRHGVLVPLVAVGGALGISFLLILLTGKDPVAGYLYMIEGGLGGPGPLGESLTKASILALTGLSVAVAFSVGLFNIGAEGQLLVGAITAAWLGHALRLPTLLHIPVALLGAAALAAAYALLPALLKVKRGVHEVISTIMLNWVALHLIGSWLVVGPLRATSAGDATVSLPGTAQIQPSAVLPLLLGERSRLHTGVLVAAVLVLLCHLLLSRTRIGFEMRALGLGPEAARASGIPAARRIYQAMALSGALSGLAGALVILGTEQRFPASFQPGYGFDGIAISLIGGNQPLGVGLAALFFGAIRAGGTRMQLAQIHRAFPEIIQGLALLLVAGQLALRALLLRLRGAPPPPEAGHA